MSDLTGHLLFLRDDFLRTRAVLLCEQQDVPPLLAAIKQAEIVCAVEMSNHMLLELAGRMLVAASARMKAMAGASDIPITTPGNATVH